LTFSVTNESHTGLSQQDKKVQSSKLEVQSTKFKLQASQSTTPLFHTMSLFNIFQIASQGMTAQRERLETASANLANSETTRTAEGGPYRRRDVVFEATGLEGNSATPLFSSSFDSLLQETGEPAQGVRSTTLISQSNNGVRRFEPNHPDADANGYVTMPDVDPLEETVNMMSAARSFEANATVFNTAKEMARASLKLGDS
jgi:flagellar basal-body rod protein FlgC